jgi:cytochrome c oxidase subunit 2
MNETISSTSSGPSIFLPEQASTLAHHVDDVLFLLIYASVLILLVVAGLLLYFGVRYRRGSRANRTPISEATEDKIEWGWMIPTALAFLVFFFWGGYMYYQAYTPPEKSNLHINAVGKQWMWKFQHPNGILELNNLHIPVGQSVEVIMTSEDVVHSLSLPAQRVKRDVIPGSYTRLWFQATQPGRYHLFCTQFCGLDHSRMRGELIVMAPSEYEHWLSQRKPAQNLAAAGKTLYDTHDCASCHDEPRKQTAPSLRHLYHKTVRLQNGATVVADEDYLRTAILEPNRQVVAGYPSIMPTFQGQLDEEDVLKLIAYIQSLGPSQQDQTL